MKTPLKSLFLPAWLLAVSASASAAGLVVPQTNPDFSQGTLGWDFWTGDTGQGAFTVESGQARIQVTQPGPNTWSVGISNPGIRIEKGRIYRVEFEAQAAPAVSIVTEIYLHQEPWTSYSKSKRFTLTGASQSYAYTFTMRQDTDAQAAFQLMAGGQTATTVFFDNVVVTDLGPDPTEPEFPPDLQDVVVDKGMEDCTVFGFSQVQPKEVAYQLFALKPDLSIRTWVKWGVQGQRPADYDFSHSKKYHYFGTLIAGGITTVIQRHEFADDADFLDMVTRDADNEIVSWADVLGPGNPPDPSLYRGSLANPRFRQYLVETCKMQIDGGADSIFFDEANHGFVGGPARNWTNNEGFDDHAIADFNRYLLDKYPAYVEADWKSRFQMTDNNILKRNIPPDDLANNFNYREYLQANGWTSSTWGGNTPFAPANPLAVEWGKQESNRIYNSDNFSSTYMRRYLKDIFDAIRAYGRDRYGKRILVTANGIFPEVDYNSLGIYQPNRDDGLGSGNGLDYVPISGNRLDGNVSLMETYKTMYQRSRSASGSAPLIFFLDWPNQEINGYYALSVEQKKDFWRIYMAEAYAAGCYYAFHLSNVMPGEPTAEESGVLDFFTDYAGYYRANSGLYHGNQYSSKEVSLSRTGISHNLMEQTATGRQVLHLINHNYSDSIQPQTGLRAVIQAQADPARVYAVSPDFEGEKDLAFTRVGNELRIDVGALTYYSAVVVADKDTDPTDPGATGPPQVLEIRPTPNPAGRERLAVSVRLAGRAQSLQVGLYSAAQTLVWRGDFPGPFGPGWNRLQWSVSGLGAGAYFLTVGADGGRRGPTARIYLAP